MNAYRIGAVLAVALLFAAPASAQWLVLVQRQSDGAWVQPSRIEKTEQQAYAQARRMCVHSAHAIESRTGAVHPNKISAVKIVGPGMDAGQAKPATCESLGVPAGAQTQAMPPRTPPLRAPAAIAPVATQPVAQPSSTPPSVQELKRNPVGVLQKLAQGIPSGSRSTPTSGHEPVDGAGPATAEWWFVSHKYAKGISGPARAAVPRDGRDRATEADAYMQAAEDCITYPEVIAVGISSDGQTQEHSCEQLVEMRGKNLSPRDVTPAAEPPVDSRSAPPIAPGTGTTAQPPAQPGVEDLARNPQRAVEKLVDEWLKKQTQPQPAARTDDQPTEPRGS